MRNIEEEVKRAQAGLSAQPELDPRWQWHEVTAVGDRQRRYVKGYCNHLETVPVESVVTGEILAYLCLTCDAQLAAPDGAQ